MPTTHYGERDPRDIEHEIAQTRAEMDTTLTALEQKLSPGQLLDEALGMVRETAERAGTSLAQTVKRHPVPVALGAALFTALVTRAGSNGKTRRSAPYDDESVRQWIGLLAAAMAQARDVSRAGGERVDDLTRDARRTVSRAATRTWRDAGRAGDSALEQASAAKRSLEVRVREQPLAALVVSLAAGALAARLLSR
jgi:ElaB/YqjD/DUF883 family membrane-anchored ribosome-binding protein